MSLQNPHNQNPFGLAYWDDELERQLQEYAGGAPAPVDGDQQIFSDVAAPIRIPTTVTPPAPPPPPPPKPDPYPFDPEEAAQRGAPPPEYDSEAGWIDDNDKAGPRIFPNGNWGAPPSPAPRSDAARIGAAAPSHVVDEVPLSALRPPLDEVGSIASIPLPWGPQAAKPAPVDARPDVTIAEVDDDGQFLRTVRGEPDDAADIEMPAELVGDPLTAGDEDLAVDALTDEDPVVFAKRIAKDRELRESHVRRRQLEEAKRHEERAAAELAELREAKRLHDNTLAEIESEGKRLADVDPDRWWQDRSTGQTIAAFISAILGGLTQHSNGGRNIGLEQINLAIEKDIAAQRVNAENARDDLGKRRTAVGEAFARTQDMVRATAIAREAAWNAVGAKIDSEAADLNPTGHRRLVLAAAARDARAHSEAARRQAAEAESKRWLAEQKERRETADLIEKHRHNVEEEKADRTRAGADWMRAKTDAKKTDAEIEKMKRENEKLPAEYFKAAYPDNPMPPHPMSEKEYTAFLERRGKGAEAAKTTAEAQMKTAEARAELSGPGGSAYSIGDQEGNPYRRKDGTIFEIKDKEAHKRATELAEFTKNARRLADLHKIMRAKYGGASEAMGSAEAQEYTALAASLDFETYKGFGLGAPSAGDAKMGTNARGGKDITSFVFDSTPGWEFYAKNAEGKLDSHFRTHGYNGPPIKLKKLETAEALERTELQNLDVYDAPEIEASGVDPDIAKRAAARALEALPALVRQADTGTLALIAQKNKERAKRGIIDAAQELDAQKQIRKAYRKRLKERLAGGPTAAAKAAVNATNKQGFSMSDEDIDRALGIVEDEKAEE